MVIRTMQTIESGTVRFYTLTTKQDYSGLTRQLANVHPSLYFTTQDDLGNMVVTVKER